MNKWNIFEFKKRKEEEIVVKETTVQFKVGDVVQVKPELIKQLQQLEKTCKEIIGQGIPEEVLGNHVVFIYGVTSTLWKLLKLSKGIGMVTTVSYGEVRVVFKTAGARKNRPGTLYSYKFHPNELNQIKSGK
jgi:hypothetical protein